MSRKITVYLGNRPERVGTIRYEAQGVRESASFEYHSEWLASPVRFAIDPGLPLVVGPQFHRKIRGGSVFHNSIADTEPDGWARRVILRDNAKRRKKAMTGAQGDVRSADGPLNHLDFLLGVDDFSRVGALRFKDENGIFRRESGDQRTAPPLISLGDLMKATRAVESQSETAAELAYLQGRGTSLGGMRPKCTVIDQDGHLSIGKFPSIADERSVTQGEVLTMQLAADAGINAAPARIVESEGTPVALIRRFDRSEDGSRLHYVSAATLMGVEPMDSTQHTYTEIVDAIRMHGAEVQADIDELWRRIAFTVLITNVDDHLLNHGFLHVEQGQWRLAPAFDINPFPDRIRELKTWISEESGPDATLDALMSVCAYFKISKVRAKQILSEVHRAVSMWRKKAKTLGMTAQDIARFSAAFEHTELDAVKRLVGT